MNERRQTLGGRIQAGRKAAGLSQEALGEQLGVSRQAVSKWESDAAVPELENLIAMSRVFGITIGALLGVAPSEQPAQEDPVLYADMVEDAGQPAPMGELTDRELAAVEAIAAKYLEAAQTSQRPRWSRKRKFLTGAVAGGVVLLAGVCLWGGLSTLGARLNEVQAQVNGIQSAVSSQIGSLTGQIRTILEENAGILSNFSVQVTNYDLTI